MKRQKKNWPAESNLSALKALSHTLLHLDIQPTKMSPLVVKHPFTDSGLVGICGEDGSLSVGNLMDDSNALHTWRMGLERQINEAETAMAHFLMITMSVNAWTDTMQHAELFGKPVLFTNWMILRDTVPQGWHCYDLQGTRKNPNGHS